MGVFFKVIAYLIVVLGVLVLMVFPNHKYSWVQDFDASVSIPMFEDAEPNRSVFMFLVLLFIVLTQWVVMVKSDSKREKALAIVLAAVAVSTWFFKFGP